MDKIPEWVKEHMHTLEENGWKYEEKSFFGFIQGRVYSKENVEFTINIAYIKWFNYLFLGIEKQRNYDYYHLLSNQWSNNKGAMTEEDVKVEFKTYK